MLTRQLHRTAMKEGRLPQCLYVGADNTPKETKNSTCVCWAIWLLATLHNGTELKAVEFQYPLVGHTHGSLDRFFSRLITSLRGRTYFTMDEMATISSQSLKAFAMNWSHHGSSYDFTHLRTLYGIELHRYQNVHSLRLYVDNMGIWVKWRQYVSDESWSTPRLLVEYDRVAVFATAKPPLVKHEFDEQSKAKHLNFLDKLEAWAFVAMIRDFYSFLSDLGLRKPHWQHRAKSQGSNFVNCGLIWMDQMLAHLWKLDDKLLLRHVRSLVGWVHSYALRRL